MWLTFVRILAVTLTFVSSFFLVKGNLVLSAADIAELSKTRWGYNTDVVKSLAYQQANTKTGYLFLLVTFLLQMVAMLWRKGWDDFGVHVPGVVWAIIVAFVLYWVGEKASNALADHYYQEAVNVLEKPSNG